MADETKSPVTAIQLPNYEPLVVEIPSGYEFGYIEADNAYPTIQIKNLSRDKFGNLTGELTAFCVEPDIMTPIIGVKFNFSNLSSRKRTVQGILESYLDLHSTWIDWGRILNDMCWRIQKIYKDGYSNIEEVWPTGEIIPKPAFLIEPILPLNQPTILFGAPGSGKGHVALLLAILSQIPDYDNNLGLTMGNRPPESGVLYLDYESDKDDFGRILSGLCQGIGLSVGIKRLSMSRSFVDCLDELRGKIISDKVNFLILDSLAPACGNVNIYDPQPATSIFNALKTLPNVTTLLVAHQAKDPNTRAKSVFGSTFFEALARSIWEIKKSQEPDSNEMLVSLTHRKSNRKRQLPLGFAFTFNDATGVISVARHELSGTELSRELPLYLQIKELLLEGQLSKEEIAETLNQPLKSITAILYKYKNLFINLDGGRTWGVIAKSES